jgi:hypothetical protein
LELLTGELEHRAELVDRAVTALRFPQRPRVHRQLDDDRPAADPVVVEDLDERIGVVQRCVSDRDTG